MSFEFIIVCIMFGIVAAVIAYFAKVIEKKADISLVVGGKLQDAINKFAAAAYCYGERDRAVERVTPINRTGIIEWIPVEERLPKNSHTVLVTIQWAPEDIEVTTMMYFAVCGSWGNFTDKVIAWAELPQPYKGRKDNE